MQRSQKSFLSETALNVLSVGLSQPGRPINFRIAAAVIGQSQEIVERASMELVQKRLLVQSIGDALQVLLSANEQAIERARSALKTGWTVTEGE